MAEPVMPRNGTITTFRPTFTAAATSVATAARPVFPSLISARRLAWNCPKGKVQMAMIATIGVSSAGWNDGGTHTSSTSGAPAARPQTTGINSRFVMSRLLARSRDRVARSATA